MSQHAPSFLSRALVLAELARLLKPLLPYQGTAARAAILSAGQNLGISQCELYAAAGDAEATERR